MRKNIIIISLSLLLLVNLNAQNVGINSTGAAPDASAGLDINFIDKGVLLPRVALTASNSASPITSPADGLLIYNTATAGSSPNNVVPGYYYWTTSDSKWNLLFSGSVPTVPGNTEYWIRPTSATYIRPESNDAVRIYDDGETYGYYYNGNNNEIAGYFRTTNSTNGACAVQGFSDVSGNQTYGYLGYNGDITVGSSTIGGSAVFGNVPDPSRTAIYGKTSGSATVAAILGYSNVWIPGYFWGDDNDASISEHPGIYSQLNVNVTKGGYQPAIKGVSIYGAGSGNDGYTVGGYFSTDANSQDAFGIISLCSSDNEYAFGGYLAGNDYYVYIADDYNNRKITGNGSVSEIIPTKNHGRITLTCPESPEYWYQDYGTVQLINGKAHVELDPILVDIIVVDDNNSLKVFIQDNMVESNGIAVINKTATGFDLIEKNGGSHSGEVDFQIIAKPKTNYGEGRFPQAPGPAYLEESKKGYVKGAKAKNQRNNKEIFEWPADHVVYEYNPEDKVRIGEIIPAGVNAGKVKLGNNKYGKGFPVDSKELNK